MQLPPFTLYGLVGCPHCASAESFLRSRNIPFIAMIANDDPIVAAGVKQLTGSDSYPVLVAKFNKEIVSGFKQEDYERVASSFYSLNSPSAPSIFASEQQSQSQASSEIPSSSAA